MLTISIGVEGGRFVNRWAGEYRISNDRALISVDAVRSFLSESYWARQRPTEVIEKSITNSMCFGIYHGADQVGFARVVTDYATVFWIGDVYIEEAHRGKGLGKELIRSIVELKDFEGLMGILTTTDAHGLYEQYGFVREPEKAMVKPRTGKGNGG